MVGYSGRGQHLLLGSEVLILQDLRMYVVRWKLAGSCQSTVMVDDVALRIKRK